MSNFLMFRFCGKQLKIIYSIIILNSIYMMNSFLRNKITTNMFFHNKAMRKNITSFFSKWMRWKIYQYISLPINTFSTFPRSAFISCSDYTISFFSTFKRTTYNFVFSTFINRKWFFTDNTLNNDLRSFFNRLSKSTYMITFVRTIKCYVFSTWNNIKRFTTNFTFQSNTHNLILQYYV